MKLYFAAAALVALAACDAPSPQAGSTSVAVAPTVVTPLLGKRLVDNDITFIINADGTMGGEFKGKPIVGIYKADSNVSCSTYTAPKELTGREFCSRPVISGNTLVFHRQDGSKSSTYEIHG